MTAATFSFVTYIFDVSDDHDLQIDPNVASADGGQEIDDESIEVSAP